MAALIRADEAVLRALSAHRHPPQLVAAVRALSQMGEHAALWLLTGAIGSAVDPRRRSSWNRGLRSIGSAYVVNLLAKNLVRRRRPALKGVPQLIKTPTQLSFPSAHAASSFAAARGYAPLLGAGMVYPMACVMSATRVYLGVHYPSDVIAGAALGAIVAGATR